MATVQRLALIFTLLIAPISVRADEGMWLPRQMPDLAERLKSMGFSGDANAFADLTGQPMGAVVSLGFCTASFVSPDGLMATNHHCAARALQYNSTPEHNFLEDGFLAKTRADELSNGPGSRVQVTVSVKDVTNEIMRDVDRILDDRARFDLVDRRTKERVAACEANGLRCRVASFFGGAQYLEIAHIELRDIRTVYAPPAGIGVFGGETDNWRWPRHTGDWAFFRAYVAPDGTPADYSPDNVPYKPAHFLPVQAEGIQEGDLVFAISYPGRTARHETFAEVQERVEWYYPRLIRILEEQIAILEHIAAQDPELAIKVSGRLRSRHNQLTNLRGTLEGLVKGGALAKKQQSERDLAAWIAADPERGRTYGGALAGLDGLAEERKATRVRDHVFRLLSRASPMLDETQTAVALAAEREKDSDLLRDPDYQERNWVLIREKCAREQRSIDPRVDRPMLRWALLEAAALNEGQRIEALDTLIGLATGQPKPEAAQAIEAFLDRLYAGTRVHQEAFRLSLLDKSSAELAASDDTMVVLARALEPLRLAMIETDKRRAGAGLRLRPRYMGALLAKAGGLVAPDANSTLRVTYGTVKGKPGPDGVQWLPFTTLKGIEQKHTGTGEFNAPKRELDAIARLRAEPDSSPYVDPRLGDVPVDFLSNVDSTGGSSGSPTLNGKGELVGLLFDGTYDTISADFLYDTENARSIHVDVRYMLWTMSEVDGAHHLVEEMGVATPVATP